MIFLRQRWKQKPRQWGPVSRVQASLFHNAERMGIPIPIGAIPFWPGLMNYGFGGSFPTTISGDPIIRGTGYYFDASAAAMWTDKTMPAPGDGFSCFYLLTNFPARQSSTCVIQNFSYSNYSSREMCFKQSGQYDYRFGITGDSDISWVTYNKRPKYITAANIEYSSNSRKAIHIGVGAEYSNGAEVVTNSDAYDWLEFKVDRFGIGGELYKGTFNSVSGNVYGDITIWWDIAVKDNVIYALSDNPYGLWQRVAPVTYFVPGGTGGGIIPISGSLTASSGITANMSRLLALAGELNSTTSISNSIKINRGLFGGLSANSNTQGQVSIARGLSGSLSAVGDVSAILTLSGSVLLSGALGATSDISASINALRSLSGSLTADAQADAQISAIRRLSGLLGASADIHGAITVTESGRVSLSGNISAMGAIQAALNIRRGLTGVVTANADATGNINLTVAMSGSAEAIADLAGSLSIVGESSLGVVIDPTITSVTTKRVLQSITIKRNINSI